MFSTFKTSLLGFSLLFVLLSISQSVQAQAGAELNYINLAPNQYRVILKVYHDCSSPILPTTQTLNYSSAICGNSGSIILNVIDTFALSSTPNNPLGVNTCSGGPLFGLELYYYDAIITFPQTCEDWIISWTSCCRSNNITNLTSSGSPIYIEAGINSQFQYSTPYFWSNDVIYLSSTLFYNHYCADSNRVSNFHSRFNLLNFDSIPIALTCPLQGPGNCLNHVAGLSASQPLFTSPSGNMSLNNHAGKLTFQPQANLEQIAATVMTVFLMENGDTVGYFQHEFPLIILDTSVCNQAPIMYPPEVFSGGSYDSITNSLYTCAGGGVLGFSQVIWDPDGDTIQFLPRNTELDQVFGPGYWTVILNTNPPFGPDSVQAFLQILANSYFYASLAQFQYPFQLSDYYRSFHIGATDNHRPIASTVSYEYGAEFGLFYLDRSRDTICSTVSTQVQLTAIPVLHDGAFDTTGTFLWTQLQGNPVSFSNDTIWNPIVTVPPHTPGNLSYIRLNLNYLPPSDTTISLYCNNIDFQQILVYDTSGYCNSPYPKAVEGKVLIDSIANCFPDSTEPRYPLVALLRFSNGLDSFYFGTTPTHQYEAHLDTGWYTVDYINLYPYWQGCPNPQSIHIDTAYTVQRLDFVSETIFDCPLLKVYASSPFMRPCVTSSVPIKYLNIGTTKAINAFIDVEIDSFMQFMGSSIPVASQFGNTYRFNLDSIEPSFSYDHLTLHLRPNCWTPLGTPYSIFAHIQPDTICHPSIPHLTIAESCSLDTLYFQVTNHSNAFSSPRQYWIWSQNGVIVDTGSVFLGLGQSASISYPTDSNTLYQLVIRPETGAYYYDYAATDLHHCIPLSAPIQMSLSGFNPYRQLPYKTKRYYTLRNSYDPNIKTAVPEGYDSAHYVLPNVPLEYTIQFQNTGNDTAYLVRILDTLSAALDIGSLDMGASSHPYTWRLMPYNPAGLHILEITVDSIMLVDSLTNEPGSHGFIQYFIRQQKDLPNFIKINNSASIYFDFNAPIKTNTYFHTVCDNCFPMNITGNSVITSVQTLGESEQTTKIYPNPTTGWLNIERAISTQATVQVFSISGRLIKEALIVDAYHQLNINNLPAGTYLIRIVSNKDSELFKVIKQ